MRGGVRLCQPRCCGPGAHRLQEEGAGGSAATDAPFGWGRWVRPTPGGAQHTTTARQLQHTCLRDGFRRPWRGHIDNRQPASRFCRVKYCGLTAWGRGRERAWWAHLACTTATTARPIGPCCHAGRPPLHEPAFGGRRWARRRQQRATLHSTARLPPHTPALPGVCAEVPSSCQLAQLLIHVDLRVQVVDPEVHLVLRPPHSAAHHDGPARRISGQRIVEVLRGLHKRRRPPLLALRARACSREQAHRGHCWACPWQAAVAGRARVSAHRQDLGSPLRCTESWALVSSAWPFGRAPPCHGWSPTSSSGHRSAGPGTLPAAEACRTSPRCAKARSRRSPAGSRSSAQSPPRSALCCAWGCCGVGGFQAGSTCLATAAEAAAAATAAATRCS